MNDLVSSFLSLIKRQKKYEFQEKYILRKNNGNNKRWYFKKKIWSVSLCTFTWIRSNFFFLWKLKTSIDFFCILLKWYFKKSKPFWSRKLILNLIKKTDFNYCFNSKFCFTEFPTENELRTPSERWMTLRFFSTKYCSNSR